MAHLHYMGHCMISKKQNNDFLDLFDFFIPGDVAQYKVESVTGYVRRGSSNPGNRTSAHVIPLHYAEVNISMELVAEVEIRCQSSQVGAEIIPCRTFM